MEENREELQREYPLKNEIKSFETYISLRHFYAFIGLLIFMIILLSALFLVCMYFIYFGFPFANKNSGWMMRALLRGLKVGLVTISSGIVITIYKLSTNLWAGWKKGYFRSQNSYVCHPKYVPEEIKELKS